MAGYLIGGRLVAGGGFDAGEITVRAIIPASAAFELPMNSDGSIDATVKLPLVDPITKARVNLAELLIPGRDFIGWVENDTIQECGPIWGDPFEFPYSDRIVANGLWSYFDHRYVLPVMGDGALPREVTSKWANLSLRTIVKRLVQQACASPGAGLPIDYEPDFPGDHEREYPGSDLTFVGEALRNITEVDGGPNITFRPKWGADRKHVRWDLLTGNPELTQEGDDHYWDTSVPDSHARVVSLDRDGSELASRDYHQGATLSNGLSGDSSGWRLGTNAANLTLNQTAGFQGQWYAAWNSGAAGQTFLDSPRATTVEPGSPVTVSAYVQATSRPMRIMLRFKNAAGATITDSSPAYSNIAPSVWQRISHSVVAPSGSVSVQAHIEGSAGAAGNTFIVSAPQLHLSAELLPYSPVSIQIEAVAVDSALLDAGFPLLESSHARSSVLRTATLQSYSVEAVARGSAHVETFQIEARRDKHPKLGTYWPGDYAKVRVGSNARVPAGTYRVRIVTISFEKNGDVTILCAPERVVSGYPVPSTDRNWLRDRLRTLSARINESTRGN